MSNVFIGYQNRIDESTLTLGSYSGALPLNNLKNRQLGKVARSTNATLASTLFEAALATQRPLSAVGLIATNFSRAARYRVRVYTDAGLTVLAYDSGWLDAFAQWTWAYGSIPWEDPHFWDGKPTEEDLDGWFPRDVIHAFSYRRLGRYVKVEIDDATNADGYVQIGRAFIGDGWSPAYNMAWGSTVRHDDLSSLSTSTGGQEFATERDVVRSVRFELSRLSLAEAMNRAFDIQRIAKTVNEVLFVRDPADRSQRLAFMGRLKTLDAISYPMVNLNATAYEIKEIL